MFDGQDDPAQNNHENDGADGAMPNNGADVDEMDDQPDLGAQAQMQESVGAVTTRQEEAQGATGQFQPLHRRLELCTASVRSQCTK